MKLYEFLLAGSSKQKYETQNTIICFVLKRYKRRTFGSGDKLFEEKSQVDLKKNVYYNRFKGDKSPSSVATQYNSCLCRHKYVSSRNHYRLSSDPNRMCLEQVNNNFFLFITCGKRQLTFCRNRPTKKKSIVLR